MTPGEDTKAIGRLEGMVAGLVGRLDRIERKLDGNGQPGVLDRLSEVEAALVRLEQITESNEEILNRIEQSVSGLRSAVDTHTGDDSKHGIKMFMKKEVLAVVVVAVAALQALVPAGSLWKLIQSLLGL